MAHLPKFLPAGDRAITIELGNAVDEETNSLVIALDLALAGLNIPGIVEMVPTYRSLLVMFDPAVLSQGDAPRACSLLLATRYGAGERLPPLDATRALWRR